MLYQCGNDFGLTFDSIRLRFPNTSFSIGEPIINFPGVTPYEESPIPEYNPMTHSVKEVSPIGGIQQWQVTPLPPEQVERNKQDLAVSIRNQRNQKLAESDWTQLPDAVVDSSAWAIYRQELRNITEQEGFPINITWPTKP